jgi:hypothetical protein
MFCKVYIKIYNLSSVVVHACSLKTWEAEAGGYVAPGYIVRPSLKMRITNKNKKRKT